MRKWLIMLMIVGICAPVFGTVPLTEINFPNVQSGRFSEYLRGWFDTVNDDVLVAGRADSSGTIYFVDGNKSTAGDGTTWGKAFNTLAAALAASHANMAVSSSRKWAARNTIYCIGDALTEDLVLLAQKTDVIGLGNNNPYNKVGLVGNHVIPSTTATPSCRFYNFQFYGDQAAEVWDVDGQGGLEFHNCLFQSNGTATVGLEASECTLLWVNACRFGAIDGIDFSSSAIEIPNDTTAGTNIRITNCDIRSDGIGINWDETVNTNCSITGNQIRTGGMCIDDEGDDVWVANNNMQCLTYGKAAFDFNVAKSQNNILTTPVRTTPIPYTNECAGAVAAAQRGSFGTIYYVDGNIATGGDGLTWETAFKTLAAALAASDTNVGVSAQRGWAQRNTIYCRADALEEDLVLLAQKTDVVGVGINNPYNKCGLKGDHVIPDSEAAPGCRFYNFQFWGDKSGILWDIDTQSGMEFHDCIFQANGTMDTAIEINNCPHFKLMDSWLGSADGQDFTVAAIVVPDDATGAINTVIKGNTIHSNAIGINWDETTNVDCWIADNTFFTATMCVDAEDVTELMVVNNTMVTLVEPADNTSNDFNIAYAVNNMVTGASTTLYIPTFTDD